MELFIKIEINVWLQYAHGDKEPTAWYINSSRTNIMPYELVKNQQHDISTRQ